MRRLAALIRKESLQIVRDPREAVAGAHLVSTDVWASMGQEEETRLRLAAFKPYQVTAELLDGAADIENGRARSPVKRPSRRMHASGMIRNVVSAPSACAGNGARWISGTGSEAAADAPAASRQASPKGIPTLRMFDSCRSFVSRNPAISRLNRGPWPVFADKPVLNPSASAP